MHGTQQPKITGIKQIPNKDINFLQGIGQLSVQPGICLLFCSFLI